MTSSSDLNKKQINNDSGIGGMDEDRESVWPDDETCFQERMALGPMDNGSQKRVAQDDEYVAHAKRIKNNPAEKSPPHAVKQRVSYHRQPNRQSLTKFSSIEQLEKALTGTFKPFGYRGFEVCNEVCYMDS
jgi:hypothetical protein